MLSYEDVAVFILGTTAFFRGQSSFDARIIPAYRTWGHTLPYLYYVFGNSPKDRKFLVHRGCEILPNDRTLSAGNNSHLSNERGNKYINIEMLECYAEESIRPLKIIRFLDCSGGYYGDGPTCRCQESMRYFSLLQRHRLEWFIFQDDDIYLRHQAIMSMLSQMMIYKSQPVAIVSARYPRGLFFSSSWDRGHNQSCARHMFPIAQPAFLNSAAVVALESLIHSDGLNRLRRIWKGTHDHLLGLSLWLYDVPVYSLSKSYYTTEISHLQTLKPSVIALCIVYHRMRNWNSTQNPQGKETSKRVIGHEQLHNYLQSPEAKHIQSTYLKNPAVLSALNISSMKGLDDNMEIAMGVIARERLFLIEKSSPFKNSDQLVVERIRNIRSQYTDYTINDC